MPGHTPKERKKKKKKVRKPKRQRSPENNNAYIYPVTRQEGRQGPVHRR